MEITLEKVDQVRERTGVSYAKAKEALEHTNGSVLDAIILLESEMKNAFERYIVSQSCSGVFDKTKSIIEDKSIRNLTMSMTKNKEDDVTGFKILFKRVKKNFDKEYYKKELKTLTYRLFGKEEMLKKSQKKNMFT